jgi:hypothetical protein
MECLDMKAVVAAWPAWPDLTARSRSLIAELAATLTDVQRDMLSRFVSAERERSAAEAVASFGYGMLLGAAACRRSPVSYESAAIEARGELF